MIRTAPLVIGSPIVLTAGEVNYPAIVRALLGTRLVRADAVDPDMTCEGHESVWGPLGETTYCDNSCRTFRVTTDAVTAHADYPHFPGMLYDCPACELACHCETALAPFTCVHCAITAETTEESTMTYFPHDVAAEVIARMDGHNEAEGVQFTADTITHSVVADGGAFLITATMPDGTEHTYRVQVEAVDEPAVPGAYVSPVQAARHSAARMAEEAERD